MSQIHLSENSIIKTNEDSNVKKGELIFDKQSQDLAIATREGVNEQLYYAYLTSSEISDHNATKNEIESYKKEIVDMEFNYSNMLALNKDGTVTMFGGSTNYYNKNSIKPWNHIVSLTNNNYVVGGVDENGNMVHFSSYNDHSLDTSLFKEKDIIKITGFDCNSVALTKDKKCKLYVPNPNDIINRLLDIDKNAIESWTNIRDIYCTYGAVIGIKENNSVVVTGYLNDFITDLSDGTIKVKVKYPLKDTEVATWTNVEKLAVNHDGIISLYNNKINHSYFSRRVINRDKLPEIFEEWSENNKIIDAAVIYNFTENGEEDPNEPNVHSLVIVALTDKGTCLSINTKTLKSIPYIDTWTNVESLYGMHGDIIAKRTKPTKTTYEMFKEQIKDRIIAYNVKEADFDKKIFGIRVDMNNADPDAACVYTDDAFKMTPMWVDGDEYENLHQGSWNDSIIQKLIGCRPCILEWTPTDDDNTQDTHVLGYLDPNDYTKWVDGRPTGILDKDNCMGILGHSSSNDEYYSKLYNKSVMIEFDKVYFYTRVDEVNKVAYIKYSKTKHNADWKCHPAFIWYDKDGNSIEKDHLYVSAYSTLRSDATNHNGTEHLNGYRVTSYPGDIRVDTIYDIHGSRRMSQRTHITNNGYISQLNNDNTKFNNYGAIWRLFDYNSFDFLINMIRIVFKNYNLNATNLLYNPKNKIPNELNNSFYKSSVFRNLSNTGLDTYNKGLFWKGYAKSGVSWYDGYFNPPQYIKSGNANTGDSTTSGKIFNGEKYMFPSLKLFGIDQIFFCHYNEIDNIYIDKNSINATVGDFAYNMYMYEQKFIGNNIQNISIPINKDDSSLTSYNEARYDGKEDSDNKYYKWVEITPSYLTRLDNGLIFYKSSNNRPYNYYNSYILGLGNRVYARYYDTSIYLDDRYIESRFSNIKDNYYKIDFCRLEFYNDNYAETDSESLSYMICRL